MGEDKSKVLEDRVIVPLVTPLKSGKFVSYGTVKRICRRIKGAGINSVIVAGKTGGIESITGDQREGMLKIVKENFNGHIFYCIGDSKSGTQADGTHAGFARVMSHLDIAANAGGVDAVVVPTLFYPEDAHHPGLASPSIENYFMGVLKRAKHEGIPMIFYNNPAMTGMEIPLELVDEFSKDPFVLGIKDSSERWGYFSALLDIAFNRAEDGIDFKVYQGSEKLIAESIALGADGIVPSLGNIFPRLVAAAAWDPNLQRDVNEVGVDLYANYTKIVEGILYGLSVIGVYGNPATNEASQRLTTDEKNTIRQRVGIERHMSLRGRRTAV